jgi:hypothetical protein
MTPADQYFRLAFRLAGARFAFAAALRFAVAAMVGSL